MWVFSFDSACCEFSVCTGRRGRLLLAPLPAGAAGGVCCPPPRTPDRGGTGAYPAPTKKNKGPAKHLFLYQVGAGVCAVANYEGQTRPSTPGTQKDSPAERPQGSRKDADHRGETLLFVTQSVGWDRGRASTCGSSGSPLPTSPAPP